jgi:lactonase
MCTDSQGNLYVALMEQGRAMVLAPNGVPIGQLLMPGRDEGQYLNTASLALAPHSRGMVVVAGNDQPEKGGALFRTTAVANGLVLYLHQ